jgi:L-iditol 2-dehydrogenase
MRKAAIVGTRKAVIVDAPTPAAKADWALVKVHAAPMCTEYKAFVAGEKGAFLGHEAAGEVVDVADGAGVSVGDRVVVLPLYPCGACTYCRSGEYIYCQNCHDFQGFTGSPEGSATMAQYLLKPSALLMPIPDDISYERASLACCALGPSFGGLELIGAGASDTVLVSGAGPVGLGGVVNALHRNARLIVAEPTPERVERVRRMGVEHVLDPTDPNIVDHILDLTDGVGVDSAVECAGVPAAQRLCIDATRRCGKIAFVGECSDELPIRVSQDMIRKGLTLIGSWMYNLNRFGAIIDVIRRSPLIEQLVSHELPMSDIQHAFEVSASCTGAKIILKPWE